MKFLSWIILSAGALFSFMVSFAEGGSQSAFHLTAGLLVNLFVIAPFVYLFIRVRRAPRRWLTQFFLLLGSAIVTGFGTAAYYDAFVIAGERDARGAVLFFTVPLIQWGGALVAVLLARLFSSGGGPDATATGAAA